MNVFEGTFTKKDGSLRKMKFVRLKEISKEFLSNKLKGLGKKKLNEGEEVVWDLEKQEFRIFNWKTEVGDLKTIFQENLNL